MQHGNTREIVAKSGMARSKWVLLTDAFWRHQFASDPAIVGKAINLSGQTGQQVTVIGVLPASFEA